MQNMEPFHLNKVIRFDLLISKRLENDDAIFFKFSPSSLIQKFENQILIEKSVERKIIWISKSFFEYILTYYRMSDEIENLENLNYVIQDLAIFFKSDINLRLTNNQTFWKPTELNFQNYEIKIADDYADYYWAKIQSNLS